MSARGFFSKHDSDNGTTPLPSPAPSTPAGAVAGDMSRAGSEGSYSKGSDDANHARRRLRSKQPDTRGLWRRPTLESGFDVFVSEKDCIMSMQGRNAVEVRMW